MIFEEIQTERDFSRLNNFFAFVSFKLLFVKLAVGVFF